MVFVLNNVNISASSRINSDSINPFTPGGDIRPYTKGFFGKIYSNQYFSFYAGEIYMETFFHINMKELKYRARNEIFRQIPLTLTRDVK